MYIISSCKRSDSSNNRPLQSHYKIFPDNLRPWHLPFFFVLYITKASMHLQTHDPYYVSPCLFWSIGRHLCVRNIWRCKNPEKLDNIAGRIGVACSDWRIRSQHYHNNNNSMQMSASISEARIILQVALDKINVTDWQKKKQMRKNQPTSDWHTFKCI